MTVGCVFARELDGEDRSLRVAWPKGERGVDVFVFGVFQVRLQRVVRRARGLRAFVVKTRRKADVAVIDLACVGPSRGAGFDFHALTGVGRFQDHRAVLFDDEIHGLLGDDEAA